MRLDSPKAPFSRDGLSQRPDRVLAQFLRARCGRVAISLRDAECENGREYSLLLGIQSTATWCQMRRKLQTFYPAEPLEEIYGEHCA
jgi:hypothetical protein